MFIVIVMSVFVVFIFIVMLVFVMVFVLVSMTVSSRESVITLVAAHRKTYESALPDKGGACRTTPGLQTAARQGVFNFARFSALGCSQHVRFHAAGNVVVTRVPIETV